MFFPQGGVRVFVYGRPTDMRKSYDGLYGLTRNVLEEDPLSGHVFVFINRRATMLKALYFDRDGFCIWSKRLEQGRFLRQWSDIIKRELSCMDFRLLLDGIEPREVKKHRRYSRKEVEQRTRL